MIYVGTVGDQPVAVKRIQAHFCQEEVEIQRLLQDKTLDNILQAVAIEQDDDFAYIASPLCEYNLEELIEKEPCPMMLTDNKRIEMCTSLLKAVCELHKLDILHRDIKPRNVLIDNSGQLYVADFGISRDMNKQTTLLTTSAGTMCWKAREALVPNARYKKSSDIQVVGSMLYYILTNGHLPFESTFPYMKEPHGVTRNTEDDHFSLSHLGRFSAFTLLLQKMIRSEPDKRPAIETCIELFKTLALRMCDCSPIGLTYVITDMKSSKEKANINRLAEISQSRVENKVTNKTTHLIVCSTSDPCL